MHKQKMVTESKSWSFLRKKCVANGSIGESADILNGHQFMSWLPHVSSSPCLWPAKAVKGGSSPCSTAPMQDTWKKLLAPQGLFLSFSVTSLTLPAPHLYLTLQASVLRRFRGKAEIGSEIFYKNTDSPITEPVMRHLKPLTWTGCSWGPCTRKTMYACTHGMLRMIRVLGTATLTIL